MRSGFTMQGADTVLGILERLQAGTLSARAQDAVSAGLHTVCEEAKALCPRDTGTLQASIHVRMTPDGGEVAADAPHAVTVETGSMNRPAQPFLFPALRAHQGDAVRGVQQAVNRYMKEG